MNSRQIECFFKVAKYLNFTEAGEKLFTSQSNVSKIISQLEEELGMTLFIRGNNFVRLTPSGAVMLSAFDQVKDFIEEQKRFAKYTELGKSGYLTVGLITYMSVEKFFLNILNRFQEIYPNIIIKFIIIENENIESLTYKSVDLILTHEFDRPTSKNFLNKRICNTEMFLLYGKKHKLFGKDNLSISDFKCEKIWTKKSSDTSSRTIIVEKILSYYGIDSYKTESSDNFENALLQICMGDGVALLDNITSTQINDAFCILPIDKEAYLMGIDVVWNKNNLNPAIALFVNLIPDV